MLPTVPPPPCLPVPVPLRHTQCPETHHGIHPFLLFAQRAESISESSTEDSDEDDLLLPPNSLKGPYTLQSSAPADTKATRAKMLAELRVIHNVGEEDEKETPSGFLGLKLRFKT